jgi:c-type cytochrome biogenesis protein CcmF
MVLCATVLLGTVYPLLLEVLAQQSVSVGAPYFNAVTVPFAVGILLLAAIAPSFLWKKHIPKNTLKFLWLVLAAVFITWLLHMGYKPLSLYGWMAMVGAIFLLLAMVQILILRRHQLLQQTPAFWGMISAHIGAAILALGITGASEWLLEKQFVMKKGDQAQIGEFTTHFEGVEYGNAANYFTRKGILSVEKNNTLLTTLTPEARFYPIENQQTLESSIYTHVLYDVYAAMGEAANEQEQVGIRLYVRPMMQWIWIGTLAMVLGGIFAMFTRKKISRRSL